MTMSTQKLLVATIASVLLAGCASSDDQARSDFNYLNEKSLPPLKIPDGLDKPRQYSDFQVPQVAPSREAMLGAELSIVAPAQVLTLVDGSIRPQGGERASIEFDVGLQSGESPVEQIWQSIRRYLTERNVTISDWNEQENVLVTDWFISQQDNDPSYFFGLEDYLMERRGDLTIHSRYVFHVIMSPTGRTARLSANMSGFKRYFDDRLDRDIPTAVERDNFTVNVLNGVVMQYQQDVFALRAQQSQAERQALSLSFQKDDKGNASIVIAAPFEQVWPHITNVLTVAGFDVDDKDKLQATYFVSVPSHWFSGLLGRENDSGLEMESGDYKFLFGDRRETTTLTIFDDDNKPISAEQVEKAFNALTLALVKGAAEHE